MPWHVVPVGRLVASVSRRCTCCCFVTNGTTSGYSSAHISDRHAASGHTNYSLTTSYTKTTAAAKESSRILKNLENLGAIKMGKEWKIKVKIVTVKFFIDSWMERWRCCSFAYCKDNETGSNWISSEFLLNQLILSNYIQIKSSLSLKIWSKFI